MKKATKAQIAKAKAQTATLNAISKKWQTLTPEKPTTAKRETNGKKEKGLDSLITAYETASRNRKTAPQEYDETLQALATACTYSVVKKIIEKSSNPVIIQLRRNIAHNIDLLRRQTYAMNNSTETAYDANGERYTKIIDKELHKASDIIIGECLLDGCDLVQTASLAIIEATKKAMETGKGNDSFLTDKYITEKPNKRVRIQDTEKPVLVECETSAIVEIFKAIRAEISNTSAVQVASQKYLYLSENIESEIDGKTYETYLRLPKYSGIVTENESGIITADGTDFEIIAEKLTLLNLTPKQLEVVKLRLSGYGYKAIGTYFGISHNAVIATLKQVQKKAIEKGIVKA